MTKKKLLEIIDSWENMAILIKEIGQHPEHFSVLMEIALLGKRKNDWRAVWMVDKIHENYPDLLLPYLEKIVQQLKVEEHGGKKRHFLKLISLNKIRQEHYGFLFDYCLNALTSAKEAPAVRVHSMQILYNISEAEPDLKPELLQIIKHEMEYHSTAGIISRGKKLVRKLEKETSQH